MTATGRASIDALLAAAIEDGDVTGVQVMAADRGGVVRSWSAGTRDGATAWSDDTVAWLASMTKSIVAVAALQLVEQGRTGLDEPVGDVLPELASPRVLEGYVGDRPRLRPARSPVTLRGLLSHTAGVGYPFVCADLTRYHQENGIPNIVECRLSTLVDSPLVYEPGTDFCYSMGIDWVGQLVARLTGTDLETALRERIFTPLGMRDTAFRIVDRSRLASVYARTPDGLLPAPFEVPQEPEVISGGAGLYGSPRDYLRFLRMIAAGGTLDGVTVLGPDVVAAALDSQTRPLARMVSVDPAMSHDIELLPGTPVTWSLLGMRNEARTPQGRPVGSLAWAGMANSYYWADAESVAVVFTQILPCADPAVIGLVADIEKALRS